MNYMEQVANLLGVKLGEKFKINSAYEVLNKDTFYIDNDGLHNGKGECCGSTWHYLLTGKYEIKKLPFVPKFDDEYFYINTCGAVRGSRWTDTMYDYYKYNTGNCFRTEKEITLEDIERILREMKGKYEHDNK